jgi:pre-mRNA cleavage complex 2 protein Pcf11
MYLTSYFLSFETLQSQPAYRLPALYVLDSICKNVGMPYTEMWGGRIVTIFMETYRVVDHAVKVRMEELLNTWRDAGPNATPLFGSNAQQNIERALWGQSGPPSQLGRRPTPQQTPQMPFQQQQQNSIRSPQQGFGGQQILSPRQNIQSPSQINNNPRRSTEAAVMMGRFDRLIAACRQEQRQNPNSFDPARLEALTKLRSIVESTALSPVELGQIGTQLDALESEIQSRTPQIHSPSNLRNQAGYRATPPSGNQVFRSPSQQNGAAAIPPSLMGALANLGKLSGNLTPPSHRSTPPPAPLIHQGSVANASKTGNSALNLIASLRSAGLLPTASIPDQDAEYCNMVKGINIRLITTDLQKEVPLGSLDAINSKELPLQCRQCTNRYPSGEKGQASLDKHLDWHFRQNRRAKDSAVRGQSRSWFSKLEHWIRGGHDDIAPANHAGQNGEVQDGNGSNGGIGASLTPAQEAELKAATKAFVIAPSEDPDAATRPCPVCKELFKSEWSEDEEEWIWKNCKLVDGIYYHGSCYYSAKTLSTNVNKKNLFESTGSRDGTPQPTVSAKPPSDAITRIKEEEEEQTTSGAKRKSDHFTTETTGEEEIQASKRQALSPKKEEEETKIKAEVE